ncbi:MAG: glycoside hydrolase family 3 C-terminal domain-containing protein [bacterium]
MQLGLFEDHTADLALKDTVGCSTHRDVAVRAVRESLVLLKNDNFLPLSKSPSKVLVAGSKSKDIGSMCGGWTITWQGSTGNITGGTTVIEAVEQMVGSDKVVYIQNATQIPDADYAIVVVGEEPYAEGAGDIYPTGGIGFVLSAQESSLVKAIKNKGIPMVVVLLSGRPLDIRDELDLSDAFIAAWLPGSEGGTGIVDILFGNYAPTGKLAHTWPASFSDVPINILGNNSGMEALFPFGYGTLSP